ncbi:MAG: thioredoxin domain-containing protein [Candidatus Komeilibacteria bacterium]|nr:thioredoxin domain-containing protein [Candidatus Komeilibacteria bacterium]
MRVILIVVGTLIVLGVVFFWLIETLPSTTYTPNPAPTNTPATKVLKVNETDPFKGPRTAPVTIIAAGSFTCPACRESATTLDQLLALYPDSVKLVWKDVPESIGDSYRAALAARCAQQQGRFWQYHDSLYAHQDLLATRALYELWARELDLKEDIFARCLDGAETKSLIDQNIGEALQAGIGEVPYFQINDTPGITGAQSLGYFRGVVEDALTASQP